VPGTFKAWLSGDTTDALSRIRDVGPWYRVDNVKIFDNKAGLAGVPLAPPYKDENGDYVGYHGYYVWTGALNGGTKDSSTCEGWTTSGANRATTVGMVDNLNVTWWTDVGYGDLCAGSNHLYCLQQ